MTFRRRGFLQLAGGAVALAAFAPVASAQTYPSRPVTMIVPFPAAGPADVLARILAERMRESLGQPVVIENVTGAAGSIATARVVRAAADGYTIILGNLGTHVVNGAIYPLQYDLAKGLRADLAVAEQSSAADRQQGHAGKGSARADRAAQGKPLTR
jgi:tripartite-type tricarboxylate transporter receptor subunit TctC